MEWWKRWVMLLLVGTILAMPASAKTFKVVIHNPNDYALTDYQVRIDLSGYLSSPQYLKVPDSSGKLLKFTYEQSNGECGVNPTTVIWVKVPYIPANGDTTIYVETSSTNYAVKGDQVFDFYDDFNSGKLKFNWYPYKLPSNSWTTFVDTCPEGWTIQPTGELKQTVQIDSSHQLAIYNITKNRAVYECSVNLGKLESVEEAGIAFCVLSNGTMYYLRLIKINILSRS